MMSELAPELRPCGPCAEDAHQLCDGSTWYVYLGAQEQDICPCYEAGHQQ